MTSEAVRLAAQECARAFGYLVSEFGYREGEIRFSLGGFALRYLGPAPVGVQVDWYPRDPLTVWIVRLVDHGFPERNLTNGPSYFDLQDLEEIGGHHRQLGTLQLYALPDEDNARLLAGNLRAYGTDLLRGDLSKVPQLQQRIRDRARTIAMEHHGDADAR